MSQFSKNLKEMRKRRGLTQLQLAQKVGVSNQIISNFERGYSQPNQSHIASVAHALNCKIADLMDYEEATVDYEKIMFSDKAAFDSLPQEEKARIIQNLQEQADFMVARAKKATSLD